MPALTLLPLLAIAALLALVTAGGSLIAGYNPPQLAAHVAFALGVLPLILAAMSYFIPVLTRSGTAGRAAWWPPLLAWAGGALAVFSFATDFSPAGLALAAALGAFAALGLGSWILDRARRMLGPRHRGLDWYLAALGFLLLALLAVVLMPWFPAQRNGLRLFHLHANLLGFVGLTALGTLQVLLPTCIGKADPDAVLRLRRYLKWAASGALLIALGVSSPLPKSIAFMGLPLALLGTALYGFVVLRMLLAWRSRFGIALLQPHGAAPSLAAAALGLLALLASGAAHAAGWLPARPAIVGFMIAFLLPLVSGAASHLLPVWLRPGVQDAWHQALRARLCRWGGLRGLTLLLLGLAISVS
ncbi:MAG: hypothetical protein Q8M11_04800 [Sulfuritalea sp.]|nr:hypothetical protein [Sulfuritalea sp.]MDP1982869.1 hypothetical protein [Sulfuritalea sp.]